jgi:hypothetical protein
VRQGHLCVWDICAFGTFVLNTRFSPFLRSLYVIQLYVANENSFPMMSDVLTAPGIKSASCRLPAHNFTSISSLHITDLSQT